ncbi:hypothetical protein BaRGS_00013365 [Batillaria attramentaria]|uniref:Uncharacterized protein n=1 Tax=Batillaria attramentaria TaxID=370345 RepID=A0ABD0L846_9CAEN
MKEQDYNGRCFIGTNPVPPLRVTAGVQMEGRREVGDEGMDMPELLDIMMAFWGCSVQGTSGQHLSTLRNHHVFRWDNDEPITIRPSDPGVAADSMG